MDNQDTNVTDTSVSPFELSDPGTFSAPLNPTGSGWDPELAQQAFHLPELPESVKASMAEPSDMDLLHSRINELENLIKTNDANYREGFTYLCGNMQWLVTMLSGVAQLAEKMPGMGGMVARMMTPKGGN